MIIRPRVIAFLCSWALLALANPLFDFIASSLSNTVVPPTGTVNIPVNATWRIRGLPGFSFDEFQIIFVQDNPVITSSVIETNHKPGETEGTIPFTPTRAGIYHLEVSGLGASAQIGRNMIVTEPSTTQAETHISINTVSSTFPPASPTLTTHSTESINPTVIPPNGISTSLEVTTAVAQAPTSATVPSSSGIPQPSQQTSPEATTSRSPLGVILGTILGLIAIIAAISLYLWYRRSSNRARTRTLDKDPTALGPWWMSFQYNFENRSGTTSHIRSEEDEPQHTSTLAPSDSVSQRWVKEKLLFEKRRPLRESTDLTTITEK